MSENNLKCIECEYCIIASQYGTYRINKRNGESWFLDTINCRWIKIEEGGK